MALGAFGITSKNGASDLTITTAGEVVCDPVISLVGMQSLTASLRFAYGSGGTTVRAYLQTSLDGGNRWIDVACVLFETASEEKVLNLSALTPKGLTTPSDGALTDDTVIDGILGDRVRLKVVSVGTYAGNSVLVGRVVAH